MFTIDPPLDFLIRGRECLVEGDLAGIDSPEDVGDLVFNMDVDLQTAEDIGLMDRKIIQEGDYVQGLGIEDPVGQGVLIRSSHLRIVVAQLQNLLSQGSLTRGLLDCPFKQYSTLCGPLRKESRQMHAESEKVSLLCHFSFFVAPNTLSLWSVRRPPNRRGAASRAGTG